MPTVIGISFREAGKIYYFDPNGIDLSLGDFVIVKTSQGTEFGEVVTPPEKISPDEVISPLKPIQRLATKQDIEKNDENKKKEKEAAKDCEKMVEKHNLPMKIIDVEIMYDNSKIIFYFSSETRVDFRELVKELAGKYKTRIELKQIGVRDEAKMIGGLGSCGRKLCCATFLKDFAPVSVKAAKDQQLPLNPFKISGVCGRLMCCLRYEHEVYKEFNKEAPAKGSFVKTEKGEGRIVDYNVPKNSVIVEVSDGIRYQFPLAEIEPIERRGPRKGSERREGKAAAGQQSELNKDKAIEESKGENESASKNQHRRNRGDKGRRGNKGKNALDNKNSKQDL
jgi:cell fate regulator YaaT (PSP1 superfamily)